MARCSYVIAYRRDGSGSRAENLAAVLQHLSDRPDTEIVVVEQAGAAEFDPPAGVTHVLLPDDGPFNKSWAMNVGFRRSTAPVVAFGDADLIMQLPAIESAITGVSNGFDAVKPFDRIVDLAEAETIDVRSGGSLPAPPADVISHQRGGEYLPFCGGLFVVNGDFFERVGGYDERFLGWGGEDDALSAKLARAGGRLGINNGRTAYHLWHERTPSRYTHAHYRANVDRLGFLQNCPDSELLAICESDARRMGDPAGPITAS